MFNFLGDMFSRQLLYSAGVIFVTILLSMVIKRSIDVIFHGVKEKLPSEQILVKTRVARTLLKNVSDIILIILAILMILVEWGVNVGPILTGAGIIGLAFSFGAQSLVKDLISGFFILLEGQFNEGDMVEINKDTKGRVYRMTLRLTILKDKKDNLIYIPNSQITRVIKLREE